MGPRTDSVRVEMPIFTQNVIYFRAITLWYQIDVGVCPDFIHCCKPRRESTKREEESEKSNARLGFEIALVTY